MVNPGAGASWNSVGDETSRVPGLEVDPEPSGPGHLGLSPQGGGGEGVGRDRDPAPDADLRRQGLGPVEPEPEPIRGGPAPVGHAIGLDPDGLEPGGTDEIDLARRDIEVDEVRLQGDLDPPRPDHQPDVRPDGEEARERAGRQRDLRGANEAGSSPKRQRLVGEVAP